MKLNRANPNPLGYPVPSVLISFFLVLSRFAGKENRNFTLKPATAGHSGIFDTNKQVK